MSEYEKVALGSLANEYSERNRALACTDVYSVTNSEGFTLSTDYFNKEVFSKNISSYKVVHRGMFAYNPSRVNVGSISWLDCKDTVVISPMYVVFKIDDSRLIQPYLDYFLHSGFGITQIRSLTSGSVRDTLKYSALEEIKIPLPPRDVQLQIVAVLDKAQSLIAARREQIAVLDKLAKDLFVDMFGDPVQNNKGFNISLLGALGEFKNGMNYSQADSGYSVLCLGVGDFGALYEIDDVTTLPYIQLSVEPPENYYLKDGDIVFVRSNGNRALVGRSVEITVNDNKTVFSGFCIRFRTQSNSLLPKYLNYALHMNSLRNELFRATRGANIQNLNQQMLSDLRIPIPPINMQQDFEKKVKAISNQKSCLLASLAELETLYQSLTERAFAGELFG
jgi:type I restriction enzyme S subunit